MDGRINRPPRRPVHRADGQTVMVSVPPGNAKCALCGAELPGSEREGFCSNCGRPATGAAALLLPAGAVPDYIVLSRAWYGSARLRQSDEFTEEVLFGCQLPDGRCLYECAVRWYPLQAGRLPAARLELFDDSWQVLRDFPRLFADLAEMGSNATVAGVCAALRANGFSDRTPLEAPAALAGRGEGEAEQRRHLRRTRSRRARRAGGGDDPPT
jgi:hypothetical protein